jgi:signal transduction histidine kinase
VPPGEHDLPLGANIRREVFLVFKESVNNMIKHSGLTESEIEFVVDEREFTLTISDNGKGFDPANESDGHGLMSMRERTHAIGGQLKVDSKPAKGTTITLTVPRENHGPAAA